MKAPLGKFRYALALLFVLLSANFLMAQSIRGGVQAGSGEKLVPTGNGSAVAVPDNGARPTGGAVVTGNGINYNGGPVLKGSPVPIYIIWYGNWNGGAKPSDSQLTVSTIEGFLSSTSLGGSTYEAINTLYGDTTGNVSGHLNFSGHSFDNYSAGTKFGDRSLPGIVSRAISGGLPNDPTGIYVVLTSSDVNETSGFCRTYCGFHTHNTILGNDLKYAFIGNVDKCQSGCEIQATGPNSPATGVGGIDGIANVLTHETEEAITDPDLNAWFDSSGNEDADKCNFKFGPTQTASNGSKFNQTFGGHNWMIQMEWGNLSGGGCEQVLNGPFFTN